MLLAFGILIGLGLFCGRIGDLFYSFAIEVWILDKGSVEYPPLLGEKELGSTSILALVSLRLCALL